MKTKIDPKTVARIIKLVECLRIGKNEAVPYLDFSNFISSSKTQGIIYISGYNDALDDVIKLVRESTN